VRFTAATRKRFLSLLRDTGCVSYSPEGAGMSWQTTYRLRERIPELVKQ